ncbi:MAG: hypothetical protein C5B58_03425 [Acidobacteria bacterium]|nr:MAG: hypothetical protein C5B58_03425 [Acidobacteriota bacterium]
MNDGPPEDPVQLDYDYDYDYDYEEIRFHFVIVIVIPRTTVPRETMSNSITITKKRPGDSHEPFFVQP